MSDDLRALALALPPGERAELAHALMDSLYQEIDWDTGPGWRCSPDLELSGAVVAAAEVVDLDQWRANQRRV
jgi:hypothetical protein